MTKSIVLWLGAMALLFATPAQARVAPASSAGHHNGGQTISWSGETWHVKSGRGNLGQDWQPGNVSVNGGTLDIWVRNGSAGGVTLDQSRHLGTFSVTYRMTAGPGKYAILLWPDNGSRPEVDLAENHVGDPGRTRAMATFHPGPGCNGCTQVNVDGNFTQWHTVTGVWADSGFTVKMDGNTFAQFPHSYGGTMHLSIQTNGLGGSGSADLQLSNVSVS